MEWRTEAQAEEVLIFRQHRGEMRQLPDLRWRAVVSFLEGAVEAAYTAEAGGDRDLSHWQSGLVDQLFGEVQAARLGHGHRRRAQMAQKQTAQMPRSDAQTRSQRVH